MPELRELRLQSCEGKRKAIFLPCSRILSPWLGEIVDSVLSCWPTSICSLAGWYGNPMPDSTIFHSQRLSIWLLIYEAVWLQALARTRKNPLLFACNDGPFLCEIFCTSLLFWQPVRNVSLSLITFYFLIHILQLSVLKILILLLVDFISAFTSRVLLLLFTRFFPVSDTQSVSQRHIMQVTLFMLYFLYLRVTLLGFFIFTLQCTISLTHQQIYRRAQLASKVT